MTSCSIARKCQTPCVLRMLQKRLYRSLRRLTTGKGMLREHKLQLHQTMSRSLQRSWKGGGKWIISFVTTISCSLFPSFALAEVTESIFQNFSRNQGKQCMEITAHHADQYCLPISSPASDTPLHPPLAFVS